FSTLQTFGNIVEGNYIGVDVTGAVALGNGSGVDLTSGAQSNTIGGTSASARNIISGNAGTGVFLTESITLNNAVIGNYIGMDVTGAVALGNWGDGIRVLNSPDNFIGGTTAGAGNIISGNGGFGVLLLGHDASGNFVQSNRIGTDAAGMVAIG